MRQMIENFKRNTSFSKKYYAFETLPTIVHASTGYLFVACGYDFHSCALGRCHVWPESECSVLVPALWNSLEFGERISSCEQLVIKILATGQPMTGESSGSVRFLSAVRWLIREMQNFHKGLRGLLSHCWSRFDGPDNGSPSWRIASAKVTLIGREGWEEITATEAADYRGTINYEVVCLLRIGSRDYTGEE